MQARWNLQKLLSGLPLATRDMNYFGVYAHEFLAKGYVFSHSPAEDAPEAASIAYIALQGMQ